MSMKWIAFSAAVALVTGGWTAGWVYVRSEVENGLDRAIADLAVEGVTIDCPERGVGGWPFRIDLSCTTPTLALPNGVKASAGALRAVTVVTDIDLVVVELDAPVAASGPDGEELTADFSLLQASIRRGAEGLGRVSVAADGLTLAASRDGTTAGRLGAARAEVHLLPVEGHPADRQVSIALTQAVPLLGGADILPAPADLTLYTTITEAESALMAADPLRGLAEAGGSVEILQAGLQLGGTRLDVTGRASLNGDGTLDGALTATGTGFDWLTTAAREGRPVPTALSSLGAGFLLIGRPVADGARQIEVGIDDGSVLANGTRLIQLPPLF